mmetsp:Transcript_14399/g.30218  ORF Transcript_14399/g.30218 Transcript_14399/m.30218 type:complete len:82 (-) Transcript_14399:857-1102(-)
MPWAAHRTCLPSPTLGDKKLRIDVKSVNGTLFSCGVLMTACAVPLSFAHHVMKPTNLSEDALRKVIYSIAPRASCTMPNHI